MIMETETVSRTRVHFLSNVCHVCKKEKPEIRCEICGMIFYCTLQHRRDNWYHHSELCRAIYKICKHENLTHLYEKAVGVNSDAFRDLRHEMAAKCTKLLRRVLNPWEYELLYHPRVCNVCHEYKFENLKTCSGCEYIYTCEKNHFRPDHEKWCRNLKTYCEVIINNTEDFNMTMKDLNGWPESMSALERCNGKNHSEAEKAIFSEILTYPLTVLHALKTIKVSEKEQVTIHMVGAEMEAEVEPIEKWERYLLHALISVKIINVLFIGPELKFNLNENEKRHVNLCEICRGNKKDIRFEFVPKVFYHDFMRSKNPSEPDLICAFNSGMYRRTGFINQDSWKETIQELFSQRKAPVIITEYTSYEIKEDLKVIKKEFPKLKFYVEPSVNSFASLKPGLNIISEEDSPVIFKNYFYTILASSGS